MIKKQNHDIMAPTIVTGHEDNFYYEIADTCVMCGSCASSCYCVLYRMRKSNDLRWEKATLFARFTA